jgi:hypothetical protein
LLPIKLNNNIYGNTLFGLLLLQCLQTSIGRDYERHVVTKRPGKLAYYPSEADLERLGRGIIESKGRVEEL